MQHLDSVQKYRLYIENRMNFALILRQILIVAVLTVWWMHSRTHAHKYSRSPVPISLMLFIMFQMVDF
ncbi:unnamed protein product [Anisakis simplex]|uniref:GGDEF domain-containing protein n=1 Tax=Anisakis simplex TaxID=6269 RepID=A0A0M3JEV0_ANISI|nr:unnamed protein product [Anisakis simplex]